MKVSLRKCLLVQVACLGLWPILLFAQSPDLAQNLANCRNGYDSCDHSKLTQQETIALALADHQQNVSDCKNGMTSCDPSRLTQAEARETSVAEHRRNIDDCQDGLGTCDRSKLTRPEM